MRFVLGVALVLLLAVIVPILAMGNYSVHAIVEFIDMATLFPFVVVTFVIIFMSGEFKTYVKALNALLSKKYFISAEDKERAVSLFKMLGKAMIGTSVFILLMGLILILGQLDDPAALGPMLAVMLISIFYGAIIHVAFLLPAIYILKNRPDPQPVSVVISEKQVINKLLELCYKQGVSPEDILAATEISFNKEDN